MLCQVCVLAVSRMSPPRLPTLLVARVVDVVAVCERTNKNKQKMDIRDVFLGLFFPSSVPYLSLDYLGS